MARCLVHNTPQPPDSARPAGGGVLASLDDEVPSRSDAVTAARIDGVDRPTSAGATTAAKLPGPRPTLAADAMPRAELLRSALASAALSLPTLAAGACAAASALRRGAARDGHQQLTQLFATIRTLTELTLATAVAADADLATLSCGDDTGTGVLGAVGAVLDQLAERQCQADWIALADLLEYDLAPAMLRWGLIFDALQEHACV